MKMLTMLMRSSFDMNEQGSFLNYDDYDTMKGLTIRSTTQPTPAGESLAQPQFEYATLVSDVDSDVTVEYVSSSSPPPLTDGLLMRTPTLTNTSAAASSQRSTLSPTSTSAAVQQSTATQDHPHMSHGNAAVGLYLVMGEGVVLILWLVLFTSIVCYSQYRKYHIAKRRSRNCPSSSMVPFDQQVTNRLVGHSESSGSKKGQSQPCSYSNFQYLNPPQHSLPLTLAEASSVSSIASQEAQSRLENA